MITNAPDWLSYSPYDTPVWNNNSDASGYAHPEYMTPYNTGSYAFVLASVLIFPCADFTKSARLLTTKIFTKKKSKKRKKEG
jgi:hypothetical protein